MRVPLIAGNWKMSTTVAEGLELVATMLKELDGIVGVEKVICPPFVSLKPIADLVKDSSVNLGAQNLYYEEKGAYTGEISPLMLAELCQFVIIGHSERRQYFGETGEVVNKKVKAALKTGLKPILCLGEKLADNEAGQTEKVVGKQLDSACEGVDNPGNITIAYEPVWAIGSGRAATGIQANETIGFIRHRLSIHYGIEAATRLRILYGGSVAVDTIARFMEQPEIDGALVGGASLDADQFTSIVRQASSIKSS
jgi:triosephosphate isomerase